MFHFYFRRMARRIFPALLWLLLSFPGISQLGVGSTGAFYVATGTPVIVDSLVLIPSTNLTLSSNSIVQSSTPVGSTINPGFTSVARVYNIGTPFTYSGMLGIIYRDSELGPNNENLLQIAFRQTPTGPWTTVAGSLVNTTTNLVSYNLVGVNLNTVTATTLGVVLPILYSNLNARLDDRTVLVDWQAESDIGISGFYVEASADSRNWTTRTYIAAQSANRYSYRDADINFATRYYRVAIIEANGDITYTRIVQVRKPVEPFSLQVLLTGGGRVVNFINGTPDGIELFDMQGRLLKQENVAQTSYNLGMLSPGVYILRFRVGSELHTKKLLLE